MNRFNELVDYDCWMRGAKYLAYPPVAAGRDQENAIDCINKKLLLKERLS